MSPADSEAELLKLKCYSARTEMSRQKGNDLPVSSTLFNFVVVDCVVGTGGGPGITLVLT